MGARRHACLLCGLLAAWSAGCGGGPTSDFPRDGDGRESEPILSPGSSTDVDRPEEPSRDAPPSEGGNGAKPEPAPPPFADDDRDEGTPAGEPDGPDADGGVNAADAGSGEADAGAPTKP